MNYNKRIGQFGEDLAKTFLIKKRYKFISSNIKISYKEIDLIFKKKDVYIFVEVKTRTSLRYGEASEAIGHKKIKNLKKAISLYLSYHKLEGEKFRLDLVTIDLNKQKKTAKIKQYKEIF